MNDVGTGGKYVIHFLTQASEVRRQNGRSNFKIGHDRVPWRNLSVGVGSKNSKRGIYLMRPSIAALGIPELSTEVPNIGHYVAKLRLNSPFTLLQAVDILAISIDRAVPEQ
jgi:hypothetical protein